MEFDDRLQESVGEIFSVRGGREFVLTIGADWIIGWL